MEHVWVVPRTNNGFNLPIGACLLERGKREVRIRDETGKVSYIQASEILRPMHPSCVEDVEDMIMLGDLHEYSILRNLLLRYNKNLIYTYTGNVLIAINPYQDLPIYGPDFIRIYQNKKFGEAPPHLYAIGDVSYQNMRLKQEEQCIIINGESGAGKTMTANLLMQYYAGVTGKSSSIEEQILESSPVLEAFGNAKTLRNPNSSRFGKYISINFNRDGRMERAEVKQFLLEKSRIVAQCKGERNYHVFYMLLRGLSKEEKNLLGLKEISFYKYLSDDESDVKANRAEVNQFGKFLKALKVLKFDRTTVWKILELLATILHFGNIKYDESYNGGVDSVQVLESKELDLIATFLGVSTHYLKSCLTKRTITTLSEKVSKGLTKQEAIDTRDAFVKALYGNLFNFIVNKINEAIASERADTTRYIGILDIFGFENFESNSFEQLCINFANECLQQFYIEHMFKLEQMHYVREGIAWKTIDFSDNRGIIDMIAIKPMNIISIINDLSKFPSSTDEVLLEKLIERHGENVHFFQPKFNNIQVFGIRHFAGIVLYDVKDFLEKNRDTYSPDFKDLARLSENPLLPKIFADDFDVEQTCYYGMKKRGQTTSLTKFKTSLDALMDELSHCQPFFVRCIKPNDEQKPKSFNRERCCQQLRYSGILETSKIRQAGYAVRYEYRKFVQRYRMLKVGLPPASHLTQSELQEATRGLCQFVLKSKMENQLGHSIVFLRNVEYLKLEQLREKVVSRYVIIIQAAVRAWLCRKSFLALRHAAVMAQKLWRGRTQRRRYEAMRHGILRLQAVIRTRRQMMVVRHVRYLIVGFQARCRGYLSRRLYHQKLQAKIVERGKPNVPEEPHRVADSSVSSTFFQKYFGKKTKKKPIIQDSYLHRRQPVNPTHRTPDQFAEMSKVVDESFRFLNAS